RTPSTTLFPYTTLFRSERAAIVHTRQQRPRPRTPEKEKSSEPSITAQKVSNSRRRSRGLVRSASRNPVQRASIGPRRVCFPRNARPHRGHACAFRREKSQFHRRPPETLRPAASDGLCADPFFLQESGARCGETVSRRNHPLWLGGPGRAGRSQASGRTARDGLPRSRKK